MTNNYLIPTNFAELLFGAPRTPQRAVGRISPMPIDVYQEGDTFKVEVEAPGVTADDFDISFNKGMLTIAMEKTSERTSKDGSYSERSYGKYSRTIPLGENVNGAEITAEYTNGVLLLTAPILEAAQPQRIEVKNSNASSIEAASSNSNEPKKEDEDVMKDADHKNDEHKEVADDSSERPTPMSNDHFSL